MSAVPTHDEHAQGRRRETQRESGPKVPRPECSTAAPLATRVRQESTRMPQGEPHRQPPQPDAACAGSVVQAAAGAGLPEWSPGGGAGARERVSRLVHALQSDVIPRLVDLHGGAHPAPDAADVEAFVQLLRQADLAAVDAAVTSRVERGVSIESIFLDLFAPAARRLGQLWEVDAIDFPTVTIGVGRLQRLLRTWSPAFGAAVAAPAAGRRILLLQHPVEQHSFGLSMVAEFFRRDGWDVQGGVGGAVPDVAHLVRTEWFDALGFSIGSETRLDWLRDRIAAARATSLNPAMVVLVGGPVFALHPERAGSVGADGMGRDGAAAPRLAENLLATRVSRR